VRVTLEIAVTTPAEAVAAVKAGADRLELCAGLELGGLTPSPGVFARVRELVDVPVWVLLRPRPGGFCHDAEEVEAMARDSRHFLDAGASGVVLGVLDERGGIDDSACRRLADAAEGRVTFHRAFDFTARLPDSLEQLVSLGFARVLTSGGQPTAREGSAVIAELVTQSGGRIEILPGGGVRADHAAQLVRSTGCNQVHAAPRKPSDDPTLPRKPDLARAVGPANPGAAVTDPAQVFALRKALDALSSLTCLHAR
jgi:copper homeostasis protein CutC